MAKSVWTTSWVKVTLGNCEIQVQKTWKFNSVVEKQLSMYKTSGWIPSVKHKYIKSNIQQFKTKNKVKNCFILLTSQTNFTSHINLFSGVVLITFSQEEYLMQSKLGMEEKESIVSFWVYHFCKAFWSKHWTIGVVPMFLLASSPPAPRLFSLGFQCYWKICVLQVQGNNTGKSLLGMEFFSEIYIYSKPPKNCSQLYQH